MLQHSVECLKISFLTKHEQLGLAGDTAHTFASTHGNIPTHEILTLGNIGTHESFDTL